MAPDLTTQGRVPADAEQHARALASAAVQAVEQRCGRLPRLRIVLTAGTRMGELAARAEAALVPEASIRDKRRLTRDSRRGARDAAGQTVLHENGILVLINLNGVRSRKEIAKTLVHELVHAWQLSKPAVRRDQLRYIRWGFDCGDMTPEEIRRHERLIDQHEREAERLETPLATRILNHHP